MAWSAQEIATLALEEISQLSRADLSVDKEDLERTLKRLHLSLVDLSSARKLLQHVDTEVELPLKANQKVYDYAKATSAETKPATNIQFIHEVTMKVDGSDRREPIEIMTRTDFDELDYPSQSGWPTHCKIERAIDRITVWPTPGSSDSRTIILQTQEYAPQLRGLNNKTKELALEESFITYLSMDTAMRIGNGVVRKISKSQMDEITKRRALALNDIEGYVNRERVGLRDVSEWRGLY